MKTKKSVRLNNNRLKIESIHSFNSTMVSFIIHLDFITYE